MLQELRHSMRTVYLLHHVHTMPNESKDVKLIGAYATREEAEEALKRVRDAPGFCELPEGFSIDECEIGRDYGPTGFTAPIFKDRTSSVNMP